jgi:hypothetical protein
MAPTLEHVLTFRLFISKEHMLALGATRGNASRFVGPLVDGYLQGDGFKADLVPGGSDWPRVDESTGIAHLDGRGQFRDSQTGDAFYVSLKGILKMDEPTQLAFAWSPEAKSTKAGDHTWLTTPIFEVSNEKHKCTSNEHNPSLRHDDITRRQPQTNTAYNLT